MTLVDTSTNYTNGASERTVGDVLRRLCGAGQLARDSVVVVSKIGYAQGENLAHVAAREASSRPYPELVRYADGCWHCIHPEFIADQLERLNGKVGGQLGIPLTIVPGALTEAEIDAIS